jgi:hypothetical protein
MRSQHHHPAGASSNEPTTTCEKSSPAFETSTSVSNSRRRTSKRAQGDRVRATLDAFGLLHLDGAVCAPARGRAQVTARRAVGRLLLRASGRGDGPTPKAARSVAWERDQRLYGSKPEACADCRPAPNGRFERQRTYSTTTESNRSPTGQGRSVLRNCPFGALAQSSSRADLSINAIFVDGLLQGSHRRPSRPDPPSRAILRSALPT